MIGLFDELSRLRLSVCGRCFFVVVIVVVVQEARDCVLPMWALSKCWDKATGGVKRRNLSFLL